jgi:uncharacterized ion transporter superfamily protein YfcC
MLVTGLAIWIAWTMWHAARVRRDRREEDQDVRLKPDATDLGGMTVAGGTRNALVMAVVLAPMALYVYGALRFDWGLNELSGAFLVGGIAAGLIGGFSLTQTVITYVEGMTTLLPAAMMVGLARSISLVLEDGRVVDTMLNAFVTPLAHVPRVASALLMIPLQGIIHIAVPSVSGQAVLTMPLFVPVSDLLGFSREVAVLTYQTGGGLMEMASPTNGALMAILLAAGVPLQRWLRFALLGIGALVLVGVIASAIAM